MARLLALLCVLMVAPVIYSVCVLLLRAPEKISESIVHLVAVVITGLVSGGAIALLLRPRVDPADPPVPPTP